MNIHYFPLTHQIRHEADKVITALNARSKELRDSIDSQDLFKQMSLVILKTLSLEGAVVTAACIPVAIITFTATPLIIAAMSLTTAITCLALSIFFDPRDPGESIVKDQWKALFTSLQVGNGAEIIQVCQELAAKQNERHSTSFVRSLGGLQPIEVTPFFHKICMAGYLLIALEGLKKNDEEQAKTFANFALSHFDQSDLPKEVEMYAKEIIDNPDEIRRFLQAKQIEPNLRNLDYILVMKRKIRQKK
jgi:hypothetical protein